MRLLPGIILSSISAVCFASVVSDIGDAMSGLQEALLSKATVLSDQRHRFLDEDGDDDYYNNYGVDFYGFSLKYAKCQTVQRFSEDAIKNGEYSAMVKDDLVVLRLCPTNQCNSNKEYGCHYNYVEYGIDIIDYVRIMLKYTIDKREKMCNYCQDCGYRRDRKLEEDEGDEEDEDDQEDEDEDEDDQEEGEEANDDDGGNANNNNNNAQFDDDDYYKGDDDGNYANDDGNDDTGSCGDYYNECQGISNWCQGAVDDDVGYIDFEDYLDYLDCVKVEGVDNYGDAAYWIRPHCDSSQQTIKMDIFYDPYCSQYAGNDVNLREFSGIYFRQSLFKDFTNGQCIDCSESNYGPYYDSGHFMCNNLHSNGARCTDNLMNQIFDDDDDTSVSCSFIDSLQSGTYNSKGEIYMDSNSGDYVQQEITPGQMAGLAISILICVGLGIYSCYLHHSITNLLIKSLSHSHLLPPSRHRHRKSRVGRGRKGDDDDWDHTVGN
mmetsp:Transcript_3456/g.5259  ORF Transcript_3456/g.5259 Transcript_3456/m.5259 type:complete len:491 (+) Transcript_3456:34-1506(+)|eukprot:CAMPEP_0194244762 /NCGR_PEP_ID=MMETSP0158-20130606/11954_1 /TAXON_ID=33649 /ORGANISM="Thalassionema nitzschioides, Strain L26-B" /LENGTH=490 /DNA_ID=CAMNT_0038980341 /DNA_START=25 /DNA_END=1497 /DNA_ORIENTATION=+